MKTPIRFVEIFADWIRLIKDNPDAAANLLGCVMNNPTLLTLLALLGALPPNLTLAEVTDIAPVQTIRERIKADREKYDRDQKLDTKRPWDGQDFGTGTLPQPKPSTTPIDPEKIGPNAR